ncbi:MAG: PBSX family phage terminase large subunit [Betaproteobacteria bacterium]|nr:PBSX family phage terminase large subunit [Betaproteobacteria bacterium]
MHFPRKLDFLFKPARYKVARGGRGSGKSWGFARALILRCVKQQTRILCTREVQKSIQQSVHQLLSDQIEAMGLAPVFEVLNSEIRGPNGSQIYFSGLSDQTAESLKSFEGVDIVWCEEAQAISKRSWDILIPTIRKDDSEIWVTYNPQLESDETHQRFVLKPPPGCVSVEMNYHDNPYFPAVLEQERAHAEATMRVDDYRHTWLGQCRPAVEGAIYFEAMSQSIAANRIRQVPQDCSLKTHVVFDLGMADSMTLILVQKVASEVRVVHYIEGTQRILADYSAELRNLRLDDQPMNWGTLWLPHDGFHVKHQTGKDDATILRGLGWTVQQVPNTGVNSGIDRAREMFPRVYFHQPRTERLVECLKRYRWNLNSKTGEAQHPLHDEFSHGADAFRYLALVADQLSNDDWGGALNYPKSTYA